MIMKRNPLLILTLAVACGGMAAYLTQRALREQVASKPLFAAEGAKVAVAARDLDVGSVLREEDVKVVDWPAGARPAGYIASASALVGQGLVFPIRANEPLLRSKLAGEGVGGLASMIPRGMRAVSVKVDEVIAVAGFVVPGTRVDVLATFPERDDRPGGTEVVLQNVKVIAAGQSFEPSGEGKPQEASVITLLVTPSQAEALALAGSEGRIQLALRNTLDESEAAPVAAPARPRVPPPAAPSPPGPSPAASRPAARRAPEPRAPAGGTVEVYHGSTRTVAAF